MYISWVQIHGRFNAHSCLEKPDAAIFVQVYFLNSVDRVGNVVQFPLKNVIVVSVAPIDPKVDI